MTEIRIGFGSDFTLKNKKVGIATTNPRAILDVAGTLSADFNITGVATFASYSGFIAQKQNINKASTIGFGTVGVGTFQQYYETETGFTDLGGVHHGDDQYYNTLSQDLVIDDGQILNITSIDMVGVTTIGEYDPHSHQSHVCLGALEELSIIDHFSVPCGGTNERKDNPIEGTVRFNDDLNTLEFFNGNEWRQFTYNQGQSGRGVQAGGIKRDASDSTIFLDQIDYVSIPSLGNAIDFGVLTQSRRSMGSCSSSIRGVWAGGYNPSPTPSGRYDTIDYVTIASAGGAIDFGNLSLARDGLGGCSSSTRGVFAGGGTPTLKNEIDYVEISTLGNAVDFGNLTVARRFIYGCSSPTRGIFGAGITPTYDNDIDFVTIASTGNALDFGDLSKSRRDAASFSSSIRGVFGGGESQTPSLVQQKTIDYVTIASTGNAIDFGELEITRRAPAGCSTNIRGLFVSGQQAPGTFTTSIEYVTIATTGSGENFYDLIDKRALFSGCSDSHGGLGGF